MSLRSRVEIPGRSKTAYVFFAPFVGRQYRAIASRFRNTCPQHKSVTRACAQDSSPQLKNVFENAQQAKTNQLRTTRSSPAPRERGKNLLLVGLGNPGPRYAQTRHNVGFEVADLFALRNRATFSVSKKLQADVAVAEIGECKVHVIKPRTFMNLSGASVRAALKWCNTSAAALLVVADDMSLEVGRVRLRARGSAGGHNGLKSVESVLGTREYARLKLGVGSPRMGAEEWKTHVLGKFSRAEVSTLEDVYLDCADVLEFWAKEPDIERVISRMGVLAGGKR